MMTDEELGKAIRENRPETPYGYDTRISTTMDRLVRGDKTVPQISLRRILVLTLAACLVLGTLIGTAATLNTGRLTIPAKLETDSSLTEVTEFPDNTMGLIGLSLRDQYPELTDKWYNIVPVDLTVQGRQTFQLLASNMYYIGECYVDVSGDNVTVTYATYKGRLQLLNECLQWFTSIDDITSDFLDTPIGGYAFGEKVSISQSLKGANTALLFVCNGISYKNPYNSKGQSLIRYWPNLTEWKEYRQGLETLLTRFNTESAQRKALEEEETRKAAEATESSNNNNHQ